LLFVVVNIALSGSLFTVGGGPVFVWALFLEKNRNLSLELVGDVGTAASSSA
jgi:hypothetical protein